MSITMNSEPRENVKHPKDPKITGENGSKPDNNRRKVEKDRRKKSYHDFQVQGTNNSSIVSKRSVEMLYNPILAPETHDWFRHFVAKGKRRSPAINRGYWVRMESIRQSVLRIQTFNNCCVQVVNLGCGFDPFAFRMLAESAGNYVFFDLDYPELVAKKLGMIQASSEILNVIGDIQPISEEEKALGVVLSTANYKLVGCDLKNVGLYERQVNSLMKNQKPSIFIAEVSLAYMKPEHANPVIEVSAQLENSHVLVLEQIMPAGKNHFFAQKMLYHFDHLTSPLQCVQQYHTKDKQQARFKQFFPNVEVVDLFQSWLQLVSAQDKARVQAVEDFDEWEEFIIFCQHYVVIHGTNSQFGLFEPEKGESALDVSDPRDLDVSFLSAPHVKFSAACEGQKGIYSFGGMLQTRTNRMVRLPSEEMPSQDAPPARVGHTLTRIGNNSLLLVGGRARPGVHMHDVWIYDENTQLWAQKDGLDSGLSRHSAVPLDSNSVLIFHEGAFYKFQLNSDLSHIQLSHSHAMPNLISAAMAYCPIQNVGYIIGGMINDTVPEINKTLYKFSVRGQKVEILAVAESNHFARIGCLAKIEGTGLYILGGAGQYLQNQCTTIIKFDESKQEVVGMRIPNNIWESGPVFIGSSLAGDAVVGGGAVCYSFGSSYNAGYSIRFE